MPVSALSSSTLYRGHYKGQLEGVSSAWRYVLTICTLYSGGLKVGLLYMYLVYTTGVQKVPTLVIEFEDIAYYIMLLY